MNSDYLHGPSNRIGIGSLKASLRRLLNGSLYCPNWCPRKCARTSCEDYSTHYSTVCAHKCAMTDAEVSTRKRRIRAGHKASATRTLAVANPVRLSLLQQTLEQKLETLKGLDTEIMRLLNLPQRKPLMMKFNKPIGSEYMKP